MKIIITTFFCLPLFCCNQIEDLKPNVAASNAETITVSSSPKEVASISRFKQNNIYTLNH